MRKTFRKKRPSDPNQLAVSVVADAIALSESLPAVSEKNPHAVALSKLGASKGGIARAAKLSSRRKKQIAQAAARKRWIKHNKTT